MSKVVTYKGPVDKSDKTSSLFTGGKRFDVGSPVEVSDAEAERLGKLEAHTFSVKNAPSRGGNRSGGS
jgi:hypothetical protein